MVNTAVSVTSPAAGIPAVPIESNVPMNTMAKKSIGVRVLLGRDLVNMRFPEGFTGIAGFPEQKSEHLLTSTVSVSNNLVHY